MEPSRTRPVFQAPSGTMRAWAEALRVELEQWPAVRITRSFGMMLVYRGEMVFAALPGTRMLHSENAIMLKFQQETPTLVRRIEADAHFVPGTLASSHKAQGEGRKWRFFDSALIPMCMPRSSGWLRPTSLPANAGARREQAGRKARPP